MKIVIAPDSFKGSLTSNEAALAIEKGILQVLPGCTIIKIPMADGGEGTLDALVTATDGNYTEVETSDPIGRPIKSKYGILGDKKTAIIEMAEASGLLLLKTEERNPLKTTTYGTGQLIKDALDKGYRNFIIAIGGSATNDGGAGMAQALGVKFFNANKQEIADKMCGGNLNKVSSFDLNSIHSAISQSQITIASDVKNPLLGPNGCTYVFSKQKGANSEMIDVLEKNIDHFYSLLEKTTTKVVRDIPGAGAAGGLGAGLLFFLNAQIQSGIEMVMNASKFEEQIKDADLVITGEGKIDNQTAFGKTIAGIAAIAKKQQIPVIAFAGIVDNADNLMPLGITNCYSISSSDITIEYSIKNAAFLLEKAVEQVMENYI
jgi:glycerate kinase